MDTPSAPTPLGLCLGPLLPPCADLSPALGAGEGTAAPRTGWHQAGSQLWPVCPNLLPAADHRDSRGELMSRSQDPSLPHEGKGGVGNVCWQGSPPHTHPFFNLLATLTKHWSQPGPTCHKLLPRNNGPPPSQSLWVRPGFPPSREAHLSAATPTLVRLPLQVPTAPNNQVEKCSKIKLPTRLPTALPPLISCLCHPIKSCECILLIKTKSGWQ